jgi:hypothetical protein
LAKQLFGLSFLLLFRSRPRWGGREKEKDPEMLHAVPCEGSTSINAKAMPVHRILVTMNHVRKHAI